MGKEPRVYSEVGGWVFEGVRQELKWKAVKDSPFASQVPRDSMGVSSLLRIDSLGKLLSSAQ